MLRRFLLAAALTVFAVAPAHAETKKYTYNKPHTQILFFVNHMGFSNSSGRFLDYDGTLSYDEAAPEKTSAEIVIKTDSLDMGDATWNEHLKSDKFFNVKQFPTMTFKSTKVEKVDAKHAKLTGDLTLIGQTHPVTLDVTLNQCGANAMSKANQCGFDLSGTLKRSEWGMSQYVPMVGDDVKLMITVEAPEAPALNGANK